jgi:hypothetical protein
MTRDEADLRRIALCFRFAMISPLPHVNACLCSDSNWIVRAGQGAANSVCDDRPPLLTDCCRTIWLKRTLGASSALLSVRPLSYRSDVPPISHPSSTTFGGLSRSKTRGSESASSFPDN